jgi:Methane oxygenase PmoA
MKSHVPRLISLLVFALSGIAPADDPVFTWRKDETTLALLSHGKTVWRLVFDPAKPKSYFHPLATMDGRVMTALEPDDHRWHRGLWWSWKFINGVNYWEENPRTGKSDGLTRLTRSHAVSSDDFSARVELDFQYQAPEQKPLLTENRQLLITPPDAAGTYMIDWKSKFTAADQAVTFERTLPPHLPGGVSYGGYAGLSLRMAKGLQGFSFRTSEGGTTTAAHGKPARWVDLSDPACGITILDHPGNLRHAPPWYLHSSNAMLFFSPSPLFNEPLELAPGASISVSYRIIVHSQAVTPSCIEDLWKSFIQIQPVKP